MPGGFVLKTISICEVQSHGIQMTCLLGPSHGMSMFNSLVHTHTHTQTLFTKTKTYTENCQKFIFHI